jgi:autotransporter-associated beta strand protein
MKSVPLMPTASFFRVLGFAALVLQSLGTGTLQAANATWTGAGTDALWSNAANWTVTPVPATGDTATFNAAAGAGGAVIDLGGGVTVNTLAFVGPSYGAYTIGAGAANAQTLTLNGSGNAGFSSSGSATTAQITINAAVTVRNTQQWVLSTGANPWIFNGNLTPSGASGSTIQVKLNGKNVSFNGVLSDQAGGAKLQMSGANGATTAILTNPNNSFTGGLFFDNGSVSVNSIGMIGSNSAAGAGGDLLFGTGFGGGTLVYTGTGNITDRVIKFNNGYFGPTITQSGASGLLKFTADVAATAVGSQTFTLSGSAVGTGEIAGRIVDNGTVGTTVTKASAVLGASSIQLNSIDGIVVGAAVSGTGIASGTTVTEITPSSKTIKISPTTSGAVAQGATLTIAGVKNVTHVTKSGTGTWTLSGANTYSGNTTVSAGTLIMNGGHRFAITNAAANKITGTGAVTLNCPITIDTSAVTTASGSWTLMDTGTLNETFGASFSLVGFSGPVGNVYTKTSGVQIWTFNRSTGVLSLTSDAVITSFGIPGSTGVINQASKTIALTVPYTPWGVTGLASLAPTFTLTSGTCNQTSGSPPSPTFASANPVTYTVTDGATVNNYVVTVSIASPSTACAMLTCSFGALGQAVINEAAGTAVLSVSPSQDITALAPTFTLSTNASINPGSGSTQNFTNPVVHRVTAENGTTFKDYTVTVQSFASWAHSGSLFIVTTPDGANLPGTASVSDFPLLLRFNSGNFNFTQAQSDGSDIRFTTATDTPLSYEIEQWDSINGKAAVWVKIPTITGNARQEIKMYWGKSGAGSQSSGSSVFNAANGYCSVMHLNGNVQDSTGSISPVNGGATATTALIGGTAMNLGSGDITAANITSFPAGTNPTSSGQVWVRARKVTNWSMPLSWGNKNAYGWNTWQMQIGFWGSPVILPAPLTCRGPATLSGSTALAAQQWYHLAYTNSGGTAKLYVNGVLDGTASGGSMTIASPQALSLGMAGGDADVDEARVSSVARSADWVKLEYENQKPVQTLVGGIVPGGSDFSVSPTALTMDENAVATLTAQAGGAQKVYWIYKKNGQETLLATDQLTLNYSPGRITGNDLAVIQFKAVFVGGSQTLDVPLTVNDTIPDPAFTLTPSTTSWDGRQTMTVTANVSNLSAMQAAGFGSLNYNWSVSGVATTRSASNNVLTLTRSQGRGPMTVTLTIDNGGTLVSQSTIITVQEPASDAWTQRTPDANEKPVNKQFFARNPGTNLGTLHYNGTQAGATDVYLKVYTTDTGTDVLYATHRQTLAGGAYSFAAPIAAGKATYKVTYGTTSGEIDSAPLATVSDLVCGDAFIIEGQSNALATDNSAPNDTTTTNKWVRTYGLTSGWGYAISKGNDLQLGLWGWYLANRLVLNNNMPVCIINAAKGGTRIDQHRPNPAGRSLPGTGNVYEIYANLYNRVTGARLSHGIRGLFWHQGEQNQGSGGINPDYDYKFYQQYFLDISAAWKQDFPNLRNYYFFQIWPAACGDTSRNDQLREVQRTLPRLYSNMKIMSTHGISPGSSCHYEPAGYQKFSDLIGPLVEQDVYGVSPSASLTAPNLQQTYFTTSARNEIALVFDQNVAWNPGAPTMLFLANASGAASGSVSTGSATGNTIKLQVSGASSASTITYLKGTVSWQQANLLLGSSNGIAALTFADVPIGPASPAGLSATGGTGEIALTWTATTGATSYKIKRSTVSGGPYTTIATTSLPAYTDLSVVGGTPYWYVVSAVNTVGTSSSDGLDSSQANATPLGGYATWASNPAQGLTAGINDGQTDDPDFDGINNLLEFVLNGQPTVASTSILPTLSKPAGSWVFAYNRSVASRPAATTQIVEYDDDLAGWTQVTIPLESSANVTITPQGSTDRVEVTLPPLGTKGFVRLRVIP